MVDSVRRQLADLPFAPVSCHQGKARPLGHRATPGIPRPARRRLLAPVQHRMPGSVPGRDELPRLPQPRRRGPVRGGLHPVARAEPGRRDVLVRLLRAVRAGLPPRRHRSPAGDPGDEAVPRRVARGVGHPRRHAPDHAARGAGRGRRRRAGRDRRRARARDQGLPGHGLRQPARTAAGRCSSACPAFRLPREAIEMDVRLVERLGVTFVFDTTIGDGHHLRPAPARLRRRSPSPPARWTRSPSTSRAPTSTASSTASTS